MKLRLLLILLPLILNGCGLGIFTGTGDVMFYTDKDFGCGSLTVFVDGDYAGRITTFYTGSGLPDCGDAGFTTELSMGEHEISVTGDGCTGFIEGTLDVQANLCNRFVVF